MNNPYLAEIAADALEQLQVEKLVPMKGTYLRIQGDLEGGMHPDTKVGTLTENTCIVCAKGALLLSHLRREQGDQEVGYVTDRIEDLEELLGDNLELPAAQVSKAQQHGALAEMLGFLQGGPRPATEAKDNFKSLAMVFGAVESARSGERVVLTS